MRKRKTVSEIPFSRDMLPHSRKALWFDVVKLNYIPLISLGLIMFAFSLPMFFNMLVTDFYVAQLSAGVSDVSSEQWMQVQEQIALVRNTSALMDIPGLAVFAIGFAGQMRVIRQYAWGEVVSVFYDFKTGIKQNIKQTVCVAVAAGVLRFLCIYLNNLAELNNNVTAYYASSAFTVVLFLFLIPVGAYMPVCISVYGNTFSQNFLQSFFLYIKAPAKSLLALLCSGGILLFMLFPNMTVHIAVALLSTIGGPFLLLGWFLFVYHQLDIYVNKEKHPEIVGKGIYTEYGEEQHDY